MARAKKKAEPRGRRDYPQEARVFSTNFLDIMVAHKPKCFVPLEDYQALERKYIKLFKRYRRSRNGNI